MSMNRDFDRIASGWLAEGPTEFNDRVLDAALAEVHLTHQRRRVVVPWRTQNMSMPIRLAAAVAIVAILGFAGLIYLGQHGSVGNGPTATCSSAPAPNGTPQPGATPLDRGTWKTYVSTQFGFSICYPADWVLRTGDMAPDPPHPAYSGLDPTQAHFVAPDESIFLSAWSVAVAPGATLDSLVQATCAAYQITCPNWQAQATPVTVDGHAGFVALLGTCTNAACDTGWTEAYLLVDSRLYRGHERSGARGIQLGRAAPNLLLDHAPAPRWPGGRRYPGGQLGDRQSGNASGPRSASSEACPCASAGGSQE